MSSKERNLEKDSEKLTELLGCKTGVPDNAAHGERVHGVVPWDRDDPPAVCHDDVPALPRDVESSLFERLNGPRCGMPGIFGMDYAGISTSLSFAGRPVVWLPQDSPGWRPGCSQAPLLRWRLATSIPGALGRKRCILLRSPEGKRGTSSTQL